VSQTQHPDAAGQATALADSLLACGALTDPRWHQAIVAVPRHMFAPSRAWAQQADEEDHVIDAEKDPDEWLRQVYAPHTAIITQRDDGEIPAASSEGVPTSSLSEPVIVVEFLELLEIRDGNTVLEVGTGSGWTAALLSQRLGANRVTTVEVDRQVTAQAQRNLKTAGWTPTVITGDGAAGWPPAAPYDRIHITCGVARIPTAWVEQCRPGAVIVLPWLPTGYIGHQLQLRVGRDGRAIGRFHGGSGYMMIRSQRTRWKAHHSNRTRTSAGTLDPREVAAGDPGLQLLFAALLPGVTQLGIHDSDGSFSLLLADHNDREAGSWAACDYDPAARRSQVTQYGDRSLWDETQVVFDQWLSLGAPARDRFGLTLDDSGQQIWLDTPGRIISRKPC
jgi:protein-L-isoaspartate(D-aspartate) O-methyltransferase